MKDKRQTIAKNIAKFFRDGDFINLGVGIPTQSAKYVKEGVRMILHSESGFVGQSGVLPGFNARKYLETKEDYYGELKKFGDRENGWKLGSRDLVDATGDLALLNPGAAIFDSVVSFMMARGGRLDVTVLGGLQVDEEGNLASWYIPGKNIPGMGGSMDLVNGAKKVIIGMEHVTKDGSPKILKKCTYPLTAIRCVNILITDCCIIEFLEDKLMVVAMAPNETKETLQAKTEATLCFAEKIDTIDIVDTKETVSL